MRCINILRWILASILLLILSLVIIVGTIASGATKAITNQENLKVAVANSVIYDNALPIALEFLTQSATKSGEGQAYYAGLKKQFDNPADPLNQLVREIFTPNYLQQSVNTVIDAFFAWLRGETERPEFEIQIARDQKTLIKFLAITFKEKIRGLPNCPANFVIIKNFNPLETTCRPLGFNLDEVDNFLLINGDRPEFKQLLNKATINSSALKVDPKTSQNVQLVYRLVRYSWLMVMTAVITLSLLSAVIIPRFRRGLVVGGRVVVVCGAIILVGQLVLAALRGLIISSAINRLPADSISLIQTYLASIMRQLYVSIITRVSLESLFLIAWGLILIIAGRHLKNRLDDVGVVD
jgi:hypothetical protein